MINVVDFVCYYFIFVADRGQFNPGFYPQRFVIKDSIVETRPEVLGILLNSTCARYAKAGVNYIEYSVSAGDLLKEERFDAMNKMTFTSPMFAPPKEVIPSEAASSSSSTSKTSKVKAASVPKVKAAAVPTLPKILQMEDPKPPWRRFVDYKEHSDSQRFVFLAAFTRDKPVGTVYCTIQPNGSWGKQEPPPPSHRDAYGTLGDIAFDTNGISAFLQVSLDRAERDSLPVANVAEENDPLVMHDKTCVRLKALAQVLCRDENVARVYPYLVEPTLDKKGELCPPAIDRLREKLSDATAAPLYVAAVVGLDWVGDELGHPFCVFSHDKFVSLVADWMEHHNPRFGVRFHAGEGPIRPSTRNPLNSKLRLAFYLHMYILCEGIKLYHRKMVYWLNTKPKERLRTNIDEWYDNIGSCAAQLRKPNIRIGHGVAFLFGCGDDREANQFNRDMEDFRVFLRKNKIVCELNPTSNHMLLPSTFHTNNSNANKPTLRCFLEEGLPVVLATDDDGIWAIHKCKRHYHHVSVAAEYCQAIERSDILRKVELTEMLWWGRQSAFSALHDSDVQVMPSEVVLRRAAIVDAEGNRIKPDGLELSRSSSLL